MYDCDEDLTREARKAEGDNLDAALVAATNRYCQRMAELHRELWMNALLALAIVALIAGFLLLQQIAWGAPSPLPKRQRVGPTPPMPPSCVMRWHGVRYAATFEPGGRYTARTNPDVWGFVGTWSYDPGRRVLEIRERLESFGPDGDYRLYEIHLLPGLREGAIGGGPDVTFVIE